jgi:phage baseplate assembly protein W
MPSSPTSRAFVGSGLAFPFEIATALGGVKLRSASSITTGTERIRQALIMILHTILGERKMLRSFGTDLRALVFEPKDPQGLNRIIYAVQKAVERWERRVVIEQLSIDPIDNKTGLLQIAIAFRELDTNQPGNLVFPFMLGGTGVPGRLVAAQGGGVLG